MLHGDLRSVIECSAAIEASLDGKILSMNRSDRLVGNRLALAGTVLYFLEWVAIAFLPEVVDGSLFGAEPEVVVAAYRGHSGVIGFAAGWFGVVLLGRVLFAVALRKAFRDSGRDSLLVDFAVGAMIVSVTLEIASFGPAAAAGWLADTRLDGSAIVALEVAGSLLFFLRIRTDRGVNPCGVGGNVGL